MEMKLLIIPLRKISGISIKVIAYWTDLDVLGTYQMSVISCLQC